MTAAGLPAGCIAAVVYLCILRADAGKAAATPSAYSNDEEGKWPFLLSGDKESERERGGARGGVDERPGKATSSGCFCLLCLSVVNSLILT